MYTEIMQYIYTFLGGRKGGTEVSDKKYNELLIKIGDYIQFENEDIIFLHTLPNDKLIEIIKIYNSAYTDIIRELILH